MFFTILEQIESDSKSNLDRICKTVENPKKMIREFFFAISGSLRQNPFLQILTNREEFEHLLRNVSPDVLAEHRKSDQAYYKKIFRRWIREKQVKHADENALMGLVATLFVLHQQKQVLDDSFEATIKLLIESVVDHVTR